jgi:hypothetical protein
MARQNAACDTPASASGRTAARQPASVAEDEDEDRCGTSAVVRTTCSCEAQPRPAKKHRPQRLRRGMHCAQRNNGPAIGAALHPQHLVAACVRYRADEEGDGATGADGAERRSVPRHSGQVASSPLRRRDSTHNRRHLRCVALRHPALHHVRSSTTLRSSWQIAHTVPGTRTPSSPPSSFPPPPPPPADGVADAERVAVAGAGAATEADSARSICESVQAVRSNHSRDRGTLSIL